MRVVGAEQHLVLADPEQQLAHDLREEARAGVHEAADDDREAGVDVALLRRHEAEVLDPRQAHVLDDEVELLVAGRDLVDVGDVERVLVQRPDRRPLVDVDVLDAQLDALLEERRRDRVVELVAARAVVPLGRVELDALEAVALGVLLELAQAGVAVTRVEAAVDDQLVRVPATSHRVVHLGRVEAGRVPLLQVRRLEHGDVDVAVLEHVLLEVLLGVLLEVLDRPVRLGRARGPGRRGSSRSSPRRTPRRPSPSSRDSRPRSGCGCP